MIFGDAVRAAGSTDAAVWIAPACRGAPGTVGALVPNLFASYLRVEAPPPVDDPDHDWWAAYRSLFEEIAFVGALQTATPDQAWFAIWEGHGFANATAHVAWREPPIDDAERWAREAARAQVRDDQERRKGHIRAGLVEVPTFDLPDRTYHLVQGSLGAIGGLRDPSNGRWRHPDLLWPDDRRWFVATDVDFWSLYVGGDDRFVAALDDGVSTASEIVTLDTRLVIED